MQPTVRQSYRAFNVVVTSEVPFSGIPSVNAEPDVWIEIEPLAPQSATAPSRPRSDAPPSRPGIEPFRGALEGVARFEISRGSRIAVDPAPGVDAAILQPALLGPAMAIVMRQRGKLVLHGSCVTINGAAIAFLGHSGWGKSTLAQAFHAQGHDIVSDDLCPVDCSPNGQARVIPSIPLVKLWPDALASLSQVGAIRAVPEHLPWLHRNSPKVVRQLDRGFCQSTLPLRCIYVLDRGDRHVIEPLGKQAAFTSLIQFSRALRGMHYPAMACAHLHQCASVASHIPIRRLQRRPSLADLPALIQLIKADFSKVLASSSSSPRPCLQRSLSQNRATEPAAAPSLQSVRS